MINNNLIMLRDQHKFSQEKVAEMLGVSRQTYSRWEKGSALPDIGQCVRLAAFYNVSMDALVGTMTVEGIGSLPPPEKGKRCWGTTIVASEDSVSVPKEAMDALGFRPGRKLVVLSGEGGLALVPFEEFKEKIDELRYRIEKN